MKRGQAKRLHQELVEGGFSEHIPTATKPSAPGFMVSDFGTEDAVPAHLSSPQLIDTFVKLHGLNKAPADVVAGGWAEESETPGEEDTHYLDVSRKYENPVAANTAMILQNQKAMFDVSKKYNEPGAYVSNPDFDPDFDTKLKAQAASPAPLEVSPTWLRPYRGSQPVIRVAPSERR